MYRVICKFLKGCHPLFHDNRGVTAVEFSLLAPVLITFFMGVTELSLSMFTLSVMEGSSSGSSRYGKTGYTASGTTREAQIRQVVTSRAPFLTASKLNFKSLSYSSLADIGDPEPFTDNNKNGKWDTGEPYTDINGNHKWDADQGLDGAGNANSYVVYQISYPWKIFTPFVASVIGNNGIINLTVRTVVKNEPYDS